MGAGADGVEQRAQFNRLRGLLEQQPVGLVMQWAHRVQHQPIDSSVEAPAKIDATTPLRTTGLSPRAVNALARCQVHTVGGLLALAAAQVRALHAIGTKTANDIIAFQETLKDRGLVASITSTAGNEPPLVPGLVNSPEPVQKLPLSDALRSALAQADLPTVGAVASLTRSELLGIAGIGRKKLAHLRFEIRQIVGRHR